MIDELKELDDVLRFLAQKPDEAYNSNYIHKSVFGDKLNLPKISRILDRLDKDGFVKSDQILYVRALNNAEKHMRGFSISSTGIELIKAGGYKKRKIKTKWNERIRFLLPILISFAALSISAYNAFFSQKSGIAEQPTSRDQLQQQPHEQKEYHIYQQDSLVVPKN